MLTTHVSGVNSMTKKKKVVKHCEDCSRYLGVDCKGTLAYCVCHPFLPMTKKKKVVKAWAIVDMDEEIPSLYNTRLCHINTNKKDAVSFLRTLEEDFPECDWFVIPVLITYALPITKNKKKR